MTHHPTPRASRRFADGPENVAEHHLAQFARRQNLNAAFDRMHQRCDRPWVQLRNQAGAAVYTCESILAAEDWLLSQLSGARDGR